MKKAVVFLSLLSIIFLYSCQPRKAKQNKAEAFVANELDFSKGVLTPELLWSLKRVGEYSLSPDQKQVVITVSEYSIEQNRSNRELFMLNIETGKIKQLTDNDFNEYSVVWRSDGQKIAFLAAVDGVMQIWEMGTNGKNMKAITSEEESISNFLYSPKLEKILYTKDVKMFPTTHEKHADLPQTSGIVFDDLMFRHWDDWEDEKKSHIFVANYNFRNARITKAYDILDGEPFDSPMKPFGGIEEIAWSPCGKFIAYTSKKKNGVDYALSTNSEIYLYDIEAQKTQNLSDGILGYDKNPVFSPDGTKIVWESMERDGFEADQNRIMVYDFAGDKTTNYSAKFDQNASGFSWSADGQKLYFVSGIKATYQLYSLDLTDSMFTQITVGDHNYTSYQLANNFMIAGRQSMSYPTELYNVNIEDGSQTQITFFNKEIIDSIKLAEVEKRWIATNDGKEMLTWVIYPPNFDPNKKYPTLLYCQGGPQSAVSQFFSYRWNFQMMAANGYIIVAPNRRGLPTFGQEWNDQISGDYGGQNMQDYLSAIDAMAEESFVDKTRLGSIGASYGGLSVFWLAGNHEKRFKTFISHDGIFNFESMYGSTEESFFVNWDMGGPYWNPLEKNSYSASPHKFVKNWDTPIMIVQGGKDFRVPETQAFEAFTAAKMRGLDAKLLYFPEENHWVFRPQNGIMWQREFFSWLDKYLK